VSCAARSRGEKPDLVRPFSSVDPGDTEDTEDTEEDAARCVVA
jgi:hypothetical protein